MSAVWFVVILGLGAAAVWIPIGAARRRDARHGWREHRTEEAGVDDTTFVRRALIQALLADATAQDAGRDEDVGQRASFVLAQLAVTRQPVAEQIHTALSFWSGWIDARERGWPEAGFQRIQWPMLARGIAADLATNVEIHDTVVLEHFAGRHRRPFARMT